MDPYEDEQHVSLQQLISSLSRHLSKIVMSFSSSTAQQSSEQVHQLIDTTVTYMPTIKQLVMALKEDKFELAQQFLEQIEKYENSSLKPSIQNIMNSFYQLPELKMFLSIKCAHQIFAKQSFPFLPQCISKYEQNQIDFLQVEGQVNKLLLNYLPIKSLTYMNASLDMVQLQTDLYDLQIKLIIKQPKQYWEIMLANPQTKTLKTYFTRDIVRRQVNDQLFQINQELQNLDIFNDQLLQYIDCQVKRILFQLEFQYGSALLDEKANDVLYQINTIDTEQDKNVKYYLIQQQNPLILRISKLILSTKLQLELTLSYPRDFQEFLANVEQKILVEFPQTEIKENSLSQIIISGHKKTYVKMQPNIQFTNHCSSQVVKYMRPSEHLYPEFVDSVNEWIQQIIGLKILTNSIKCYNSLSRKLSKLKTCLTILQHTNHIFHPQYKVTAVEHHIKDQCTSQEGIALESLLGEDQDFMCFLFCMDDRRKFLLKYRDQKGDNLESLYFVDEQMHHQLFVTKKDQRELIYFIFPECVEQVTNANKKIMWILLRDILRQSILPSLNITHTTKTIIMHKILSLRQQQNELKIIVDFDSFTISDSSGVTCNLIQIIGSSNTYIDIQYVLTQYIKKSVADIYTKFIN